MTREEMTRMLGEWIGRITEKPAPELKPETHLIRDLGLDSLALAELGALLRIHQGIRIRNGEFAQRMQVGKLLDLVDEKLREKND